MPAQELEALSMEPVQELSGMCSTRESGRSHQILGRSAGGPRFIRGVHGLCLPVDECAMMTRKAARQLVADIIDARSRQSGTDLAINDRDTREESWGWGV